MKKYRYMTAAIIFVTVLGLMGPLSPRSFAQGGDRAMIRAEVMKTDDIISEVRDVVTLSRSVRARDVLNISVKLQTIAKDMMRMGRDINALKYTRDAREKAQQALAITRQADENEDILRRRMERAEEMINRVKEQMPADAPQQVRTLYEAAQKQFQRSQEYYHNHQFKAALELSIQVERTLRKILEMSGNHLQARERFHHLAVRYERLREAAEGARAADRDRVKLALEQATKLRESAEEQYSEQRYIAAERQMQRAVETLTGVVAADDTKGRISSFLDEQHERLQLVSERAALAGNDKVRKALENAQRHMKKARELYAQEKYTAAAEQLAAARNQMDRAERMLQE
jgi:hypothetical protein